MTRRWSLASRLAGRILAVVTVGWGLAVAVGLWSLEHELDEAHDQGLEARAQYALELLAAGKPADQIPLGEGDVLRVDGAGAPWPAFEGSTFSDVSWHVVRAGNGERKVELAQPASFRREEFWESAGAFLVLMVPLILALLATILVTVRRGLRPAGRLASALSSRDASDLSPVEAEDLPEELRPVPLAINRYLERIDGLVRAERFFASHAAHELRTPIATARAEAQAIATGDGNAEALEGALDRLTRIVDRLLQLARAEAAGTERLDRIDLVELVPMVLSEFDAPVVFDDGDFGSVPVESDLDLLAIVLRNLVSNAVEHGTGDVKVRLGDRAVTVENAVSQGSEFLGRRFAKRQGSPGLGIGLSIVDLICERLHIAVDRTAGENRATTVLRFR